MKKMKKALVVGVLGVFCFSSSASAFSLNNPLKALWGEIDKGTNGLASVCYTPSFDMGSLDPCSLLDKISKLELDVCKLAPPLPGFKKKEKTIGLSGIQAFCRAKARQFESVVSKTASDVAENTFENGKISEIGKLPNGDRVVDYMKKWDLGQVLKKTGAENAVYQAVINGKNKAVEVLQEYAKTSGAKSIEDIKVEDIKVAGDMLEYKNQVVELAASFFDNVQQTSTAAISSILSGKIAGKDPDEAQTLVKDYMAEKKMQFRTAKANEIGHKISLARDASYIPIPTQEYVDTLRYDLKLEAIADIRKQQMEEAQIMAEVSEKWDRREALADIIADKEIIMAQEFDEEAEKNILDQQITELTNKAKDMIKEQVKNIIAGIF